ncbi:sugar kinase [candidate division WOR-3 bacterium]|nr:sugar kinase [candidate division WOR-3 bacterium]
MNDILAVGSVALDTIENSTGRIDDTPGGSLSYFTCAAALFKKVIPLCAVGTDFPPFSEAWGTDRKFDKSNLSVEEGRTFRWGGKYSKDLDFRQTLFTELGVFENFEPVLKGRAKNAGFVFLGNISPHLQLSVIEQSRKDSFKALDTMNYWIDGFYEPLIEAISKVDLLFINDQELLHITGRKTETSSILDILELGPRYLVLKKGKNGAFAFSKDRYSFAGIYKDTALIDTTGAGDSFAGGVMGYLASTADPAKTRIGWKEVRNSLVYGAAAASYAVEGFGLSSLLGASKKDIEKRASEIPL